MIPALKQYKFLVFSCLFAGLVLISLGPYLQPDSDGYLQASYGRGLLYPLFLKICLSFGNLYGVVAIQLLLGLGACVYTIICLSKMLEQRFGIFTQIALLMALAMPYLGHTIIGNTILTEPLCYPLFLVFFCQVLLWRKFANLQHLLLSLALGLGLMLTRKQFGYIFAIFYIWLLLDFMRTKKINWAVLLLPLFVFAAALGLENSYMYLKTGHFVKTPSGSFVIATPLYIAKASDVDLLQAPLQKQFLQNALKERDRQKLAMHQEDFVNFSWPYHKKFEIIHDVLRYEITNRALTDLHLDMLASEALLNEVTLTVLKNNLADFFKFYYHNIISNMGGYYYFFLICCTFLGCLWKITLRENHFLACFGLMATSLQFLNFGAVAIFLPVLRRFSLYTEGLMICFFIVCLHQVMRSKNYD